MTENTQSSILVNKNAVDGKNVGAIRKARSFYGGRPDSHTN